MTAPNWAQVAVILGFQIRRSPIRDIALERLRGLEVRYPEQATEYRAAQAAIVGSQQSDRRGPG